MRNLIWMFFLIPLSGCLQQVTKPSEITLVEAMREVGEGLAAMREAQGDVRTGLIAESAEVTFKISADAKNGGKLKVDLAAPAVSDGVGVGGELSAERTSGRSNTVTVKFKNLLTLPKDSVGYAVVGAQIGLQPEASAAPKPDVLKPGSAPRAPEQPSSAGTRPTTPVKILPDDINKWIQSRQPALPTK
ncbi:MULTISPECIES: hypothetical protein [unclassified Pseudomonas]|uniref:hypothetical protein n=1 Tax=unclassified Pseudomonas TaxID=196821 RepID=UPI0011A5637B|nr:MULTISPECIES: hypothetical protein [unclassified Pseudomonas]TWC27724.1 hypothetical protein FBY05_101589 [Pseudomonas sp. SJZ083]TWC53936.1 hypothetical protein FBY01_101127 [Pseudomonas sp. SJZ077]